MRKWVVWALSLVAVAGSAAAVGWAAATIFRPLDDPIDADQYAIATAERGFVESALSLTTIASWPVTPVGSSQATGIVTSISIDAGQEVGQGTELYAVDLRPVVVGRGDVPSFRPIALNDEGDDVAQLQRMLGDLGFYTGVADGKMGAGTESAVRAWQQSQGVERTGVVDIGAIIFVPSLPSRVSLEADAVVRGQRLAGGEQVLNVLPSSPAFAIPVTESQAQRIAPRTAVEIPAPDGSIWTAVTGDQQRDPTTQTVQITLVPVDDEPICRDRCGDVPVSGESQLASRVVAVPRTEGTVVPSAALVTDAGGASLVIDESGTRREVRVVASANGLSVVEGVDEGERIRIPGLSS